MSFFRMKMIIFFKRKVLMELKMKSPKKCRDDSQNIDDMFSEGHIDYTLLTESGISNQENKHL